MNGKDEYMKAGEYYKKALEFATRLNSKRFVINASYNLAGVEYRLGDYLSSKTHLTNLLKTIKKKSTRGLIAQPQMLWIFWRSMKISWGIIEKLLST